MKKFFVAISAALMLCASASAQEFAPSWNVQVKGGVAQTTGETEFSKLISPNAEIGIGYQFTPVFGLRAMFSGWQGKGSQSWGDVNKNVFYEVYKYNYVQGSVDAVLDICNMFKVKETRVVNPYIVLGIGETFAFNNDEALALNQKIKNSAVNFDKANFGKLWEDNIWTPVGRAMLGVDFRVNEDFSIFIEAGTNMMSDYFNSKDGGAKSILDYQNTASVGLKFCFGRKKIEAPAPVVVPCEPTVEYVDRVVEKVVEKTVEVEAPAPTEIAENIFFVINKWDIRPEENVKIIELANFMNQNPESKVVITGYADKDTGTAKRNMFLSEQRAKAVTNQLVKYGISKDRISYSFKGDQENPFATPEENRVSVCIAK